MVLENTLESPLDCKEIQPVHARGNHSWIFIGRTDAEAETPMLWQPVAKNWLIGKDPDAGKDWRQEKKGVTEDEMVGWHHWLNGHEFAQALGVGDRQGSLVWCSPWGCKSRTRLNDWTELNWTVSQVILMCSHCWETLIFSWSTADWETLIYMFHSIVFFHVFRLKSMFYIQNCIPKVLFSFLKSFIEV